MKKKSFQSFQEYLDHRGKVVAKPPVEDTPDYKGPKVASPPKGATKGKGWEVPNVSKGSPKPYATAAKGRGKSQGEKGGFAEKGDKSLVYEPAEKATADGKKAKSWPNLNTTESFLSKTKDMNTSQFAKHVKKSLSEHCGCENKKAPHVVAYSVGAFHPDPIQAIRYVTYLANENVNLRRALVREAQRTGCASSLLNELIMLPESFTALARLIDSEAGESFNRRLAKAIRENRNDHRKKAKINEEVDEPAHKDDLDLEDADESELEDKDSDELDLDDEEGGSDELDLDAPEEDGPKGDGDELDLDDEGNGPSPEEDGPKGDGDELDLDSSSKEDSRNPFSTKDGDELDLDDEGNGPSPEEDDDLAVGNNEEPPPHPEDDGEEPPPHPEDDGEEPPPHPEDDGEVAFGGHHDDDDELDLDDDNDDLDLDDDDDDDDDLDDDKPKHHKSKMPWED